MPEFSSFLQDLGAILDERAVEEADVLYASYVAPDGASGNHWVADLSTDDQYVVGSSGGNVTWVPGTVVPLARAGTSQAQPKFILGAPPPGIGGGAAVSLSLQPGLPVSGPNGFWAYVLDNNLAWHLCSYDLSGNFIADLGTLSFPGNTSAGYYGLCAYNGALGTSAPYSPSQFTSFPVRCISNDVGGAVQGGSLAFSAVPTSGSQANFVWEPQTGHVYTISSGTSTVPYTGVAYFNGALYWFEASARGYSGSPSFFGGTVAASLTLNLWTATCAGAGARMIGSFPIQAPTGLGSYSPGDWWDVVIGGFGISAGGAITLLVGVTVGHGYAAAGPITMPASGGTSAGVAPSTLVAPSNGVFGEHVPASGGSIHLIGSGGALLGSFPSVSLPSGGLVWTRADSDGLAGLFSQPWPGTGTWVTGDDAFVNASCTQDLSSICVYDVNTLTAIISSATNIGSQPDQVISVSPVPSSFGGVLAGNPPIFLFLNG